MNHPAFPMFPAPVHTSPQEAMVAAAALPLVIYGYPLIETLRTCRLQTSVDAPTRYGRAPMNMLSASARQWTHEDRDIVTPANDLLYFCGWLNLADGPATIRVPALPDADRYYVIELLDAHTNNFANLGPRNVPKEGADIEIVGPGQRGSGGQTVESPTSLVWIIGRVLVTGADDLARAYAFEQGFQMVKSAGPAQPPSVAQWQESDDEAVDFFQNLYRAMRDFPPTQQELGLFTLLRKVGLRLEDDLDIGSMRPSIVNGLRSAYAQAMVLIEAHTRSQGHKAWGYSLRLGTYGDDWLLRACTAMKGLGALRADEAVYAMADFDADGERLHGNQAYELRFPPGMLPPADAFWSVSLYGEDRFFTANELGRYAVGDRTPGLRKEPDGTLVIPIGHARPAEDANWLPAPSSHFYLILRLYHPSEAFRAGQYTIPAVRRVG
ncbi:DUF1254 domain-containing protein [Cupriavidus metallidurans]|uniref:DUF1254 domain-containing protein n=1 Tax=Cupriavidus metallidurans TaxID=119219 RepID=UPI001CCF6E35|nr:DUF1254 domain-containing protein [Cupriavidus metallidurans]UBM07337.1 DUF1254 domain-containing protein [Cupriavidus metallidurans]